jgi:hypothetical protein
MVLLEIRVALHRRIYSFAISEEASPALPINSASLGQARCISGTYTEPTIDCTSLGQMRLY